MHVDRLRGLLARLSRHIALLVALAALPGVLGLALLVPKHPTQLDLYYQYANLVLGKPAMKEWIAWFPHRNGPEPTTVALLNGPQVPYLDFNCEYPPFALAVMSIPRVFADDLRVYNYLYKGMAALVTIGVLLLLIRMSAHAERRYSWLTVGVAGAWSLMVMANGSMITTRFDIFSVALVLFGLRQIQRDRFRRAGWAFGFGGAIKLWPTVTGMLLALALFRTPRRAIDLGSRTALAFFVPHLALVFLAEAPAWSYFGYHAARGVHLESVVGNLIFVLTHLVRGEGLSISLSYGAYHLGLEPGTAVVSALASLAVTAPLLLLVLFAAAQRKRAAFGTDLAPLCALLTGTFAAWLVVSAKVFSGEYLIWLAFLAIVPVAPGWPLRAALLAAAGFITKRYYASYEAAVAGDFAMNALLTIRNALVGAALVSWVWPAYRALRREDVAVPASSPSPLHASPQPEGAGAPNARPGLPLL